MKAGRGWERGRRGFSNKEADWKPPWPDLGGTGLWPPRKVWPGGEKREASPPASPPLTEHEHGTMAHHGGAMLSPVPRAEETGRQKLLEREPERSPEKRCLRRAYT